jgi:predicted O-linked N-acetylglucosamine transferase (SPINDLY family)
MVAEYHSNLGVVLGAHRRFDEAVASYRKALALNPNYAEAHNNLGNALIHLNRFEEAVIACSRALELTPRSAIGHYNLANAFVRLGKTASAILEYRKALQEEPDFLLCGCNLVIALGQLGRWNEAVIWCRQALERNPRDSQTYHHLAIALAGLGQLDEAIVACWRRLELEPTCAEAQVTLGRILTDMDRFDEAIAAYGAALVLRPDSAEFHNNLGVALTRADRLDDALISVGRALALRPDLAAAHSNKGAVLKEMGRIDEAVKAYRQALAFDRNQLCARHNLILAVHYHPDYDAQALLQESLEWSRIHAEPLRTEIRPHHNVPDPDRPLRIGYVSPDFRAHVAGYSVLPLISHHDRDRFAIFCYSSVRHPDAVTETIRASATHWRHVYGMSDERAAELIRSDAIDILVDLALHSAGNRLLVFARKPAPIQVIYLAYCGTSGMTTVDYRLSDPYIDPLAADLSCYAEQTIRLPQTYWCYQPREQCPEVSNPPVFANGYVTFGSMNNFAKASEAALDLWSEILRRVKNSRMLIHSPSGDHRQWVINRFTQAGVGPDRVQFVGRQPWIRFMESFDRTDIALDPFPYAGGMTTCDTLWMGVPVVSMSGRTAVGRGGQSILCNIGLPELVAHDPEQYVRIAVDLASDTARLANLRRKLRDRMQCSPLMHAGRFTAGFENAYRQMWKTWCSGLKGTSTISASAAPNCR